MPLWSKRFFSIEGSNVKYYRSEDSMKASGAVNFFEIRCVKPFETRSDQNIFSLQIIANSRSFFLRAHSAAVRDRWVLELNYYLRVWTGRGGETARGRRELAGDNSMGGEVGLQSTHCRGDQSPLWSDTDDDVGERTSYASSYASDVENGAADESAPNTRDHTVTTTTYLHCSPTALDEHKFRGKRRSRNEPPSEYLQQHFQTMPGQIDRNEPQRALRRAEYKV